MLAFGTGSEGKRTPGKPRNKWENNIKVKLEEVGCGAQDRDRWRTVVNAVMNLQVP